MRTFILLFIIISLRGQKLASTYAVILRLYIYMLKRVSFRSYSVGLYPVMLARLIFGPLSDSSDVVVARRCMA